jgi:xylulokinase
MSLLGLDIGTTGCKAIAFDEDGRPLASAYREYPLLNPWPGFFELEPDVVWSDLGDCVREVNGSIPGDPVKALAISAQGEAVIPVSEKSEVLANSPVTADNRALAQADQLRERLGAERIYAISGQPIHGQFSIPKIAWWKHHEPSLYKRTWKFLCYGDFALQRLGLEPIIDYSMASRMLGFDNRSLTWSEELLGAAGIDVEKLPIARPSGSVVGEVSGAAANDLGLPSGVQVVVGGHDQPCGALGAGVLGGGEAMYAIGTTESILAVVKEPTSRLEKDNVPCYPHVVPQMFAALTGNQTGGRLLRWYRDQLGAEERATAERARRDVYDVIVDQVGAEPSGLMILPHFAGSGSLQNDPTSKGAILGLTFDTRREDLVKAILEGITFEQALSIRQLRTAGIEVSELRAIGGGARSKKWLQMKADIIGTPVCGIEVSDAASLGAAILAGWGTGIYASLQAGVERTVAIRARYTPNEKRHVEYRDRLGVYEQLYPTMRALNSAI